VSIRHPGFIGPAATRSARFQGDLDPEIELNTLVVGGQPFARLDRFQGDFSTESAQNIDVWDGSE
jgi:hypothetical protein